MLTCIAVVDDHELVRKGLVDFISSSPGLEIVAEAVNGAELLELLSKIQVDLILLDIHLPDIHGAELIGKIKNDYPGILILALSGDDTLACVQQTLKAGASGYISKSCSPNTLLDAIHKVIDTGKYLSPQMAEELAYTSTSGRTDDPVFILSPREMEVFRLIYEGKNVAEIARQLSISDKTVSTHKCNLLCKLEMKSTADLVRFAIERRLF